METREGGEKVIPEIIIPWAIDARFYLPRNCSSTPTFSFIDGWWFATTTLENNPDKFYSRSEDAARSRTKIIFSIHLSRILPKGEANLSSRFIWIWRNDPFRVSPKLSSIPLKKFLFSPRVIKNDNRAESPHRPRYFRSARENTTTRYENTGVERSFERVNTKPLRPRDIW